MRTLDTLPAWAARQRSRLLGRRSDEKIVRWINHRPAARAASGDRHAEAADTSSNDNDMPFASGRTLQAH